MQTSPKDVGEVLAIFLSSSFSLLVWVVLFFFFSSLSVDVAGPRGGFGVEVGSVSVSNIQSSCSWFGGDQSAFLAIVAPSSSFSILSSSSSCICCLGGGNGLGSRFFLLSSES